MWQSSRHIPNWWYTSYVFPLCMQTNSLITIQNCYKNKALHKYYVHFLHHHKLYVNYYVCILPCYSFQQFLIYWETKLCNRLNVNKSTNYMKSCCIWLYKKEVEKTLFVMRRCILFYIIHIVSCIQHNLWSRHGGQVLTSYTLTISLPQAYHIDPVACAKSAMADRICCLISVCLNSYSLIIGIRHYYYIVI